MEKYNYKPSNIEWADQTPKHWEIKRLFNVCDFVRGNSTFQKNELLSKGKYVALQYGKTYKVEEVNDEFQFYVNDEFYKRDQTVEYGDVIFVSTSETMEDLGHSVFYNREDIGLIGGEQILLKPHKNVLDGKYLFYSSKVFGKELNKFATGIKVSRFDVYDLKTVYVTIPPLPEQKAIAEYLDKATAKIDRVIAIKMEQVEKVEENIKALIYKFVTGKKTLTSCNEYKPSGIKWLGEIPKNWKVDRIKDLCERITGGGTPKSNISEYWEGGNIIWISPTDFSKQKGVKYIECSDKKITELGLQKSSANLLPIGSVIMSSRASIGEPKIAGKELCTNQGFISFITNHKLHNNFLFYCIEAQLGEYFSKIASGTTFMEISRRIASMEEIPLPPLSEQKEIAEFLDISTAKFKQIENKILSQIETLQSYRKSLIQECVTGKKQVAEIHQPKVTAHAK